MFRCAISLVVATAVLSPCVRGSIITSTGRSEVNCYYPSSDAQLLVDLDGDGQADLRLSAASVGQVSSAIMPATGSDLQLTGFLQPGDQVDGGQSFSIPSIAVTVVLGTDVLHGQFGFRFTSGAATHYGWAVIDLEANFRTSPPLPAPVIFADTALDRWAYESDPNTPITVGAVPEPESVVMFLVTAPALLVWRPHSRT